MEVQHTTPEHVADALDAMPVATEGAAEPPHRRLAILGTRGIPATYGGFETFAEHMALHLVEHGWEVTVYCQELGTGPVHESVWQGVRLVHVPVASDGARGSINFDWRTACMAAREAQGDPGALVLTLGYNTALFWFVHRLRGVTNIANMDGIEWKRAKWSRPVQAWFWLNEKLGSWLADHLIADHPEIKRRLTANVPAAKITTIWYGADAVNAADANPDRLAEFGVAPGEYAMVVARAEPENSILEIVTAFSRLRTTRKLLVLGNYRPDENPYHRAVLNAAGSNVIFPGAVYDHPKLDALRFHSRLYVHGHQVGGTNPSLLEALGANSAVLAHDNPFNRWVAGSDAAYFDSIDTCHERLESLMRDDVEIAAMKLHSRSRHAEIFRWQISLGNHEALFERFVRHGWATRARPIR